ncbi:Crp/Fnr family transcriptional regulator [Flectobacillus rivi]|uniref:Crp/Fnr family transcriptional regulator n=1 Tax=Flectobacillus rivi TaxID=2984209 RepID=A0ABT6ZAE3_9BACT|nr:Crp/Fnr family transcriptional regulator [Flectobacillus rivi]MDI9877614.1 Crp/Fnr family transcriptional regulator [Flectobacillus rivi]
MLESTIFDSFIKYLHASITLSDVEIEMIRAVAIQKKLRRRQYLLQEGDTWKYNAFVCKGFLKTFTVDDKGQEHIMNFSPENYWTGDRESLMNASPSKYNIDAIEDSEIILIEKNNFDNLCQNIPQLNNLVNTILQRSFIVSQSRINANISLSAEEKYEYFLTKFPLIANRIPQHMIASYIGITPETLTRIRRNSAKK